eukprot:996691-Pyramimonas_sp.AAC.1
MLSIRRPRVAARRAEWGRIRSARAALPRDELREYRSTPQLRIRARGRRGRRQSARPWRSPPQAPNFCKLRGEPAAGADFFVL